MRFPLLAALTITAVVSTARADCPTAPDDRVCRPWSAILLPTIEGGIYAPRRGDPAYGGGVEAVLFAWSDNSQAFGPSQGRVRFDIGVYRGDPMTLGSMVRYRTGAQVAFERNASREWLIPYFTIDLGGMWSELIGRRWFVDGGIGVYVIHRRTVIVDLEATGVLPFREASSLGGVAGRLAASFALW